MKQHFAVLVERFIVLQEIEDSWQPGDYIALLDAMEYEAATEIANEELRDMCLMSLQDLEPEDAAAVVLKHRLSDKLSKGQIANISHEMPDEKMWEEYADISLHEQMFNVGSLLYAAFPGTFPKPDAVQVRISVTAKDETSMKTLKQSLPESFIVRLLAEGMDHSSTLHRLFEDQLGGDRFPEAESVVWIVRVESTADNMVTLEVISSGYWLDALRETRGYESTAVAD